MKNTISFAAFALWVLIASAFVTHIWLTRPDLLPPFPSSVAEPLVSLYGAENAEEVADLEMLIGFGLSIPLVAIMTFGAIKVIRRLKNS